MDIVGFKLVEFILKGFLGFVKSIDFLPLVSQLKYHFGNGSFLNIILILQLIMFLFDILQHILIRLMLGNTMFQLQLLFFSKLLR